MRLHSSVKHAHAQRGDRVQSLLSEREIYIYTSGQQVNHLFINRESKVKITKQDYARMEELITSFVESNNIMAHSEYPGMTITRYCWGIFHSCLDRLLYNSVKDYLFLRSLYSYLKDDHINTALKNILIK